MEITEGQRTKFFDVTARYEAKKEELKALSKELEEVLAAMPVGTYLQDPQTKLVYKITEPQGTFVTFKKRDYDRTKKAEEKQGSLSMKEAKEAGFTLE